MNANHTSNERTPSPQILLYAAASALMPYAAAVILLLAGQPG
jgi:hypothetical protein